MALQLNINKKLRGGRFEKGMRLILAEGLGFVMEPLAVCMGRGAEGLKASHLPPLKSGISFFTANTWQTPFHPAPTSFGPDKYSFLTHSFTDRRKN